MILSNKPTDFRFNELCNSNGENVVLSNDVSLRYFNFKNSPHRRLGVTKDRIFLRHPTIYFRKKSILRNLFNNQIRKLTQSGLVEFWSSKYTTIQNDNSNSFHSENLRDIFQLGAFMHGISFIVFILELISIKRQRIRILLDFLTYWIFFLFSCKITIDFTNQTDIVMILIDFAR